jgi:adenosine/AMP kinase
MEDSMEVTSVRVEFPADSNIIIGQAHFIKTAEDIFEIMVNSVPQVRFGLAFCEASCDRLIRKEGNDPEMVKAAVENASRIGAGHTFVLVMKEAYPINVLNSLKQCPEVCHIFCATANPLEVLIVQSAQGRGVIGVIDGESPVGVEGEDQLNARRELLRNIKYKL